MINLDDICSKVMNLCFEVGEFIISEKSKINLQNTEIKGIHNFVTYVDKASEKRLVGELSLILPESGFIAEEGTSNKIGKEFNWIIDPLDGTTNFIHGLSPFCISIALRQNDKIVLGVIYDPNLKEIFYAWEGGSAFLNGKVINVSKSNKLDNSLLATGFPYSDYSMLQNYLKVFEWCLLNTH
ncbi:MAG: inositol monophosphatase, partial [Bacteroidetes bacterium]|nr:inositol monophosphatase [Bacteroidota bacterium]